NSLGIGITQDNGSGVGIGTIPSSGTMLYVVQNTTTDGDGAIIANQQGNTANITYGVYGSSQSTNLSGAGVMGYSATGAAGVLGQSNSTTAGTAAIRGSHSGATANATYG